MKPTRVSCQFNAEQRRCIVPAFLSRKCMNEPATRRFVCFPTKNQRDQTIGIMSQKITQAIEMQRQRAPVHALFDQEVT